MDDLKEFFEGENLEEEVEEGEEEKEKMKRQLFDIKVSSKMMVRKTKKVVSLKKVNEDNSRLLDFLFAFIGVVSDESLSEVDLI